NGVMNASVSPGSSQRAASVTCTPQVSVPSGAAHAGPGKAQQITASSIEITERARNRLMGPPSTRGEVVDVGSARSGDYAQRGGAVKKRRARVASHFAIGTNPRGGARGPAVSRLSAAVPVESARGRTDRGPLTSPSRLLPAPPGLGRS